jgi:dienelactone hydrolase
VKLNTQPVAYTHDDRPLTGFLVWDDSRTKPGPGIFVAHGGAGLDDHARGRARRLAALGYVVFAGDMYGDGVAGDRQRILRSISDCVAIRCVCAPALSPASIDWPRIRSSMADWRQSATASAA